MQTIVYSKYVGLMRRFSAPLMLEFYGFFFFLPALRLHVPACFHAASSIIPSYPQCEKFMHLPSKELGMIKHSDSNSQNGG